MSVPLAAGVNVGDIAYWNGVSLVIMAKALVGGTQGASIGTLVVSNPPSTSTHPEYLGGNVTGHLM